jgi:hypothetical protein
MFHTVIPAKNCLEVDLEDLVSELELFLVGELVASLEED